MSLKTILTSPSVHSSNYIHNTFTKLRLRKTAIARNRGLNSFSIGYFFEEDKPIPPRAKDVTTLQIMLKLMLTMNAKLSQVGSLSHP